MLAIFFLLESCALNLKSMEMEMHQQVKQNLNLQLRKNLNLLLNPNPLQNQRLRLNLFLHLLLQQGRQLSVPLAPNHSQVQQFDNALVQLVWIFTMWQDLGQQDVFPMQTLIFT
jgi:hypothetical protein